MAKVDGNLLLLNDFSIPLHLSIQDVYTQLLTLPLGTDVTLGDFVNTGFDVFNVSKVQDERNIEIVKNTIRNLVAIIQDDSTFAPILQEYVEGVQSDDGNIYANMYKNLVYCRHFLRKSLLTVFVGLTIVQESKKDYNENKKREQLRNLRKLLLDTTNIIMNLDALPSATNAVNVRKANANTNTNTNIRAPKRFQFGTLDFDALVNSPNLISEENIPNATSLPSSPQEIHPDARTWADIVEDTEEQLRMSFDAAEEEFKKAEAAITSALTNANAGNASTAASRIAHAANKVAVLLGVIDAAKQKAQESTEELFMPDLEQRLKEMHQRADEIRSKAEALIKSASIVKNSANLTRSTKANVAKRVTFGDNEYRNVPKFSPQDGIPNAVRLPSEPKAVSLEEQAYNDAQAEFTNKFDEIEEEFNAIKNPSTGTKTNVNKAVDKIETMVKDLDSRKQKAQELAEKLPDQKKQANAGKEAKAMDDETYGIRGRATNALTKAMRQK